MTEGLKKGKFPSLRPYRFHLEVEDSVMRLGLVSNCEQYVATVSSNSCEANVKDEQYKMRKEM